MTVCNQMTNGAELARARAALYQFLSSFFAKPPEPDFLGLLAKWSVSQSQSSPLLAAEPLQQALVKLGSFFTDRGRDSREGLERDVSVEFTRLFRGVQPIYSPPPPYESVYREEDGCVFSEITTAVHEEYRRFGLDLVSELGSEPPDHISLELEFMSFLCRQEAEAWAKDETAALKFLWSEKEFAAEHLLSWLPKLCDQIRQYDRLGLFSRLADLTESWVLFDFAERLQELSLPDEEPRRLTGGG